MPRSACAPRGPLASAAAGRGLFASAAAAVESFFVEPVAPPPDADSAEPHEQRPVVCVFGLAHGSGVTVVARALAAELAVRDRAGTAAVCCEAWPAGIPLATHAATRLAQVLEDVPGAEPRAMGRLCLVGGADPLHISDTARHHAPLVIDAGSAALGGAPASVADRTVIVTTPAIEPALAHVGAECVARAGPAPIVVLNRAPHDQRGSLALPNSPMGARLALGGREARGALGEAIADLADLIEELK
ncbi:MAG TPA: hypothetical protein VE449_01120 [Thermoleophilaceae bacterium]|jgi:hypothetical protein|nr:hypothetical protein [Thermoleophilaceae bacterium]